ncbi:DMT family transporter [Planktotalea sp.]|uniref:DMT family transporter n=1 Tax=Planktotalea sp. TaxID=2029877 RepID=UPI0025F2FF19|nr:DMT family transporter [Planktotalea sp.]
MELWIFATIVATIFQTVRFMLQKQLSMGALSTGGATFARFAYSAPLLAVVLVAWFGLNDVDVPKITARFWLMGAIGGLAQIMATVCVVALFRTRNFAVGITFKKTEVILSVLVGIVVLGEGVSGYGFFAILIGLFGVLLLSKTPSVEGGWVQRVCTRAAALGLGSGFLFAISAVTYRAATLEVGADAPLLRAAVTLSAVTLMQFTAMAIWLRVREPGQLGAVWSARRKAALIGLTSVAGSLGWFVAFTLQTAAYVNALGQIELIFSLIVSTLVFKEKLSLREGLGIGFLSASVLLLILVTR